MSSSSHPDYRFDQYGPHVRLPRPTAPGLAQALGTQANLSVYPDSLCPAFGRLYFMGRRQDERLVGCLFLPDADPHLEGTIQDAETASGTRCHLATGPANAVNAGRLRAQLPFLRPAACGLAKSAGTGDRLGLATPGHVEAFRAAFRRADAGDAPIFPILAQQSIRENARTGRTPRDVIDDAMWGVLQTGWTAGYGADADHLKTLQDVNECHAAGYTFFTVDPGDHVDDSANTVAPSVVEDKVAALDWATLDSSPGDLAARLADRTLDLGSFTAVLSREEVWRAAAKYGSAVAHTVRMARHLASLQGSEPYDLEMSVDETATITSLAEHIYIAHELQRLHIPCVSLAPRYTGMFEKGVDFIGDLEEFARSFRQHVAVAQCYGPYKLSLHSGSDKFSIYPIAAALAQDLIHLKTAGTSYLEAVRAIGHLDPALFRSLLDFAVARYEEDRQAYHVSARIARMQPYAGRADAELPALLDDFHTRQILHVTFGSVLQHDGLCPKFLATLHRGEDVYRDMLVTHFVRHLSPFL